MVVFYSFSKLQIKNLVEIGFGIKVLKINTFILPHKNVKMGNSKGRRNLLKRVVVLVV